MKAIDELGKRAAAVKYEVQKLTRAQKDAALEAVAQALQTRADELLAANAKDMEAGRRNGMHEAMLDRLQLNEARIGAMAEGVREVAALPDPVGETIEAFTRPNGLKIEKVRVPMGVIGIIYESRPNVTADAFALCFKAGSACILKGGSDALHSNAAIAAVIRDALERRGIDRDAIQLIEDTDRETARAFMQMSDYVDVLIPRGSGRLISAVKENSRIPVIETGTGNCHVYVDASADVEKAVPIIVNGKTQRIGVCNAVESLVIHEAALEKALPPIAEALKPFSVELRADEAARALLPEAKAATEEDYGTEYLDYILSVKTVRSLDEAIAHINRYNTGHSDTIVTEDREAAERFLAEVDAACVYVNASTRFTDGFQFGFGAEIGISTQKLHARGPMGLKELTSYKYRIVGNGQIRP